ncbi:hypothetical protein [Symbiopectobacterium purcellii]|uniref:hypothetical protein n=1 Tax=Symbiopectobacterium purcellii TaxID=2871826 RepID=UPI003F87557F
MNTDWRTGGKAATSGLAMCCGCGNRLCIAKRHYFDNSQLCFFAAYQGIGCNHF